MIIRQVRSRTILAVALASLGGVSAGMAAPATPQTTVRPAPAVDAIAWDRGGLRGVVVGPYSPRYFYPDAGSTIALRDGTLLHVFNRRETIAGQKDFHVHYNATAIVSVASRDGGRSWGPVRELFRSNTGNTASNPSLVRLRDGTLGASYNRINSIDLTQQARAGFWTESVKTADRVFRYSRDEGRTWSREIAMTPSDGYWTGAHDRFLTLSSGRILHPLHTIYSRQPYKIGVRVTFSDDDGRTWRVNDRTLTVERRMAGYRDENRGAGVFAEANLVERRDGTILLIGRTLTGLQYQSVSRDRGETWSDPTPTEIVSPEAPARIARIPGSNDLLMIWTSCCVNPRNVVLGERLTLSSAISTDEGRTWKWRREVVSVAPGIMHAADYPSIFFHGGGVFVSYSAGTKAPSGRALEPSGEQGQVLQHYMARLPVGWFYAERDNERPQ